ncbi:MAG: isoprenylcysteine carboxylmethyltransferase family protein [Opitutaceae bacterium]|nr:isoprenylcysteine carboxylmethyltransferase family protein [Opitutaceae bacterium]
MRALELKIPPVAVGLIFGTVMWGAAHFAPVFNFTLPAGQLIAAGLAAIGLVIAVLGVVSFRRAKTTVNPLQPAAASSLVISGIYRRTRNPMYLGLLLVLLGWGALLGNALAFVFAAAFIPLMNRLQILPEERFLAARFGTAFTAYQSAVRRWI